MLIDFDRLKIARPALFRSAVTQLGYGRGEKTFDPFVLVLGTREIHELDPDLQRLLTFWISTDKTISPPEEPAEQIDMAEVLREEQADMKRAADERRGLNRLRQFQDEQGLRDCKENADAIRDWLAANCKGYVSQDMIDAAVMNLGARGGKNVLLWNEKTAPAPPPAPIEVAEVLGTLPNGEPQLPLDVPPSRASKEQAKDWLARTRAATGKYSRPSGSWGSSF